MWSSLKQVAMGFVCELWVVGMDNGKPTETVNIGSPNNNGDSM